MTGYVTELSDICIREEFERTKHKKVDVLQLDRNRKYKLMTCLLFSTPLLTPRFLKHSDYSVKQCGDLVH